MKKVIISGLALLCMAAIIYVLYNNKKTIDENKVNRSVSENGVAVSTEKAFSKETDNKLILVGTTIPLRETQPAAQTGGEITEIHFSIGAHVGKGTLLARIDDKMKKLAYENAKATADKLETDLAKIKNMYERNAATETQFRETKYALETAKNQVEQTKRSLDYTKVLSPFDGVIIQKNAELGSYANPGTPICRLVDVSKLKISINVSEKDIYQLGIGKKVEITTSVHPNATYSGAITYISPVADQGHNYPIEISINNSKEYPLKSGTFVKAEIGLDARRKPLLISRQAIVGSINDAKVYVVANGTASLRKVTIGTDYDKYLEVLDGLAEGEEIVTGGQLNLDDNTKVRVINN